VNESQFKALRELSTDSNLTQRELSRRLGLSLGSVNYVVRALIDKGYIKAKRFKNSNNKLGYAYILTPEGIKEKLKQTQMFIHRKIEEYEKLKVEIELLKREERRQI
jgi:EPS-associated MarR family transcriptional regulator